MHRLIMYILFRPFVREHYYRDSQTIGYTSSLDVFGKCLAFRRLDGRLQFRW